MTFLLPRSPVALAVVLFGVDLALAVVMSLASRIVEVDLSASLLAAMRSYAAAVIVGAWYAAANGEVMSKEQSNTLSLIYCAASFVILSVVFMLQGAAEPLTAILRVFGTLIVLTIQYFLLAFLVRKTSEIVFENRTEGQQRLPGM